MVSVEYLLRGAKETVQRDAFGLKHHGLSRDQAIDEIVRAAYATLLGEHTRLGKGDFVHRTADVIVREGGPSRKVKKHVRSLGLQL